MALFLCEIVHFSWLSLDLKYCWWPGSRSYVSEFKCGSKPIKDKWKKCVVKTKCVSADLDAIRDARQEHLETAATDSEVERVTTVQEHCGIVLDIVHPIHATAKGKSTGKQAGNLPPAPVIQNVFDSEPESEEYLNESDVIFQMTNELENPTASSLKVVLANVKQPMLTAADLSVSLKSILTRLTSIELKVDNLSKDVKFIRKLLSQMLEKPEGSPVLPLHELDQLSVFDEYLEDDKQFIYFQGVLALNGANGEKEATDRVLAQMISNTLAVQLNWKGTIKQNCPTKVGLSKYGRIVKLINQTVRVLAVGATDKVIQDRIQYWLKHAKIRIRVFQAELIDPQAT
ncbi:unnamed protein product [Allacma fusca]|uniref:DUF4806 domain-containing protein n=1 Tax=Allacma fusca TaxID=39272 RepID=A0A8J2KQN3_9HEXA|nr:unnamed protein product [Allacma fusca]